MLNHITFYSTAKVLDHELKKLKGTLPEGSPTKVNFSTGVVEIGEILMFHKILTHDIREQMRGVQWHGYKFHSSVRIVETAFVNWLNCEVSKNDNRFSR